MKSWHNFLTENKNIEQIVSSLETLPGLTITYDDDTIDASFVVSKVGIRTQTIKNITQEVFNKVPDMEPTHDDPHIALYAAALAYKAQEREFYLHSLDGQNWSLMLGIKNPNALTLSQEVKDFVRKAGFVKHLLDHLG
jgi:hypothetical protein